MHLFRLSEPSHGPETPGFVMQLNNEPRITFGRLPNGDEFSIPLGKSLAKQAVNSYRIEPGSQLLAAELVNHHTTQQPMFVTDKTYRSPAVAGKQALVHLETAAGEGGVLILTGPKGAPQVIPPAYPDGRPEVDRLYMSFKDAPGVTLISPTEVEVSEENGVVQWKEECDKPPFLLISMLRGASFRVFRTGELEGAPREFTIYWSGSQLYTTILSRKHPFQKGPGQAPSA